MSKQRAFQASTRKCFFSGGHHPTVYPVTWAVEEWKVGYTCTQHVCMYHIERCIMKLDFVAWYRVDYPIYIEPGSEFHIEMDHTFKAITELWK